MKKIYISAPFRRYTTEEKNRFYGVLNDQEYKQFLENIFSTLKKLGCEVFFPHRDEGDWGKTYILPENITEICFNHIQESDLIIVFPRKSRGVHIEIGYAAALNKKMLIFIPKNERESTLLRGLCNRDNCKCLRYSSQEEVFKLLSANL